MVPLASSFKSSSWKSHSGKWIFQMLTKVRSRQELRWCENAGSTRVCLHAHARSLQGSIQLWGGRSRKPHPCHSSCKERKMELDSYPTLSLPAAVLGIALGGCLLNLVRAWPGSVNSRRLSPSPNGFWPLLWWNFPQFGGAELAEHPTLSCPSYCFPPSSHIQPIFSPVSRFWHAAGPSPLSAAFLSRSVQEGLKHDPELEWVPKVRIVFEKRDKICSNGVFGMTYLLVFDIPMVESRLLSFRIRQSWGLLPQKWPSGWLGLPGCWHSPRF